MLKRKNY